MNKIIFILMAMGLVLSCGKSSNGSRSPQVATPSVSPKPQIDPVKVDRYLKLVNDHRASLGLSPVETTPIIEEVSLEHSRNMAQRRMFFGHGGWRARCRELRERLKGSLCGEIVARGQKTPEDVFKAWLNSPPHRQVIEGPSYTHTGLGQFRDSRGMIYWTQMFLEID